MHIPWGDQNWKRHSTPMFTATVFKIARTWKQPRCPLKGEWIKKLSYIYTMVQLFSRVRLFAIRWITARQASISITNSQVHSNLCPLSWWCHPAISSSVIPFSSCPQSFPASGSFPVSLLFASGGHWPMSPLDQSFQRIFRVDLL